MAEMERATQIQMPGVVHRWIDDWLVERSNLFAFQWSGLLRLPLSDCHRVIVKRNPAFDCCTVFQFNANSFRGVQLCNLLPRNLYFAEYAGFKGKYVAAQLL